MGQYKISVAAATRVRELIAQGTRPAGMFVTLSDPAVTDIIASSGFNFIIVDNEHTPLGLNEVLGHVRAAVTHGVMTFVRVRDASQATIQSLLDIGVDGLIIPHIESAGDIEAVVKMTRFPPHGTRGAGPSSYAAGYAMTGNWSGYKEWASSNALVIPIIESAKGVENIEEICAVDGVDAIIFGPGDLSQDLGLPLSDFNVPPILEAWERTKAATKASGKWLVATWINGAPNVGADLVFHGYDTFFLREKAQQVYLEALALPRT